MTRHEQCENSASKRASSSLGARAARPHGAPSGATDLAKGSTLDVSLVVDVSLALRAHGGRAARAPSEEEAHSSPGLSFDTVELLLGNAIS